MYFFFWFVTITVTLDLEPIPPFPTTLAQFGFKRMSVVSPVKTKYSAEEEEHLRLLITLESPLLHSAEGLRKVLSVPPFSGKGRSLASIRTKVKDVRISLEAATIRCLVFPSPSDEPFPEVEPSLRDEPQPGCSSWERLILKIK